MPPFSKWTMGLRYVSHIKCTVRLLSWENITKAHPDTPWILIHVLKSQDRFPRTKGISWGISKLRRALVTSNCSQDNQLWPLRISVSLSKPNPKRRQRLYSSRTFPLTFACSFGPRWLIHLNHTPFPCTNNNSWYLYNAYLMPNTVLSILQLLEHLILVTTLWGR